MLLATERSPDAARLCLCRDGNQRRTTAPHGTLLDALRDLSSPQALVLAMVNRSSWPGRELVSGGIVLLAEGDRVPADIPWSRPRT